MTSSNLTTCPAPARVHFHQPGTLDVNGSLALALTQSRPVRVGVDLDGVVYDFVDAFRRYLITHRGVDASALPDACCWDFPVNHWGLTWPSFADLMHEATDAEFLFVDGGPYPGAIDALNRIADAGHEIHVVTDRSWGTDQRAHTSTRQWLDRVAFPHQSVTFSADKTAVPCDVFVEDRDKNYRALTDAGVTTFLMDRAYNRHVHTPRRIRDLGEYADAILAAA